MRRCLFTATAIGIFTFSTGLCHAQTASSTSPAFTDAKPPSVTEGTPTKDLGDSSVFANALNCTSIEREVKEIAEGLRPGPAWVATHGGTYTTVPFYMRRGRCGNEPYPVIAIGPTSILMTDLSVDAAPGEVGQIIEGSDGEVRIRWREGRGDLPDRLYFVKWQGDPCVVTQKQIADMLNKYNTQGLLEIDWYQKVDHDLTAESVTQLPPQFANGFHSGPITVEVGSINPSDVTQTYADRRSVPIELRSGTADGVYVGMDLPCTLLAADARAKDSGTEDQTKDAEWPTLRIVIDHAEEHRSTGTLWITATAEQSPTLPQAGDRLKTFQKRQVRPD
jgi:hypothetical protein